MLALHLVCRSYRNLAPLTATHSNAVLWKSLQKTFPDAMSCVLMPNHLHLILPAHYQKHAIWKLGILARAFTKRFFPGHSVWERIPPPTEIPDVHHLARNIRYVHLNPCRKGLVKDPLSWLWSTHRDVCDLVFRPWIDSRALLNTLQWKAQGWPRSFHRYVSSDPSVQIVGSAFPCAAKEELVDPRRVLRATRLAERSFAMPMREKFASDLAIHICHQKGLATPHLARTYKRPYRTIKSSLERSLGDHCREKKILEIYLNDRRLTQPGDFAE